MTSAVPAKLDGQGNYTLGISDHTIFPEVSADGTTATIGMDICINTSATNDEHGRELLSYLGMPFRKSTSELAAEEAETSAPEARGASAEATAETTEA